MDIQYKSSDHFAGWEKAPEFIRSLLTDHNCKRILELGSGANPTLSPDFVKEKGLSYVTSDLNHEELDKADPVFERLVIDLSGEDFDPALNGSFDCVFSRMVNEHIRDGRRYHANVYKILKPGGISVHLFVSIRASAQLTLAQ
jgi:SAM-dependent methyltransferase